MIAAFLLAAAAPTAVDAELAFARDAQHIGQWAAFRKWADRDAVVFTPQAAWAREALPKEEPPKAIHWLPAHSFVSCDGHTAVNTGPWWRPDGALGGYFTTVWQRTKGQWRWAYDGGGPLSRPVTEPVKAEVTRATCGTKAPGAPIPPPPKLTAKQARTTPDDNGRGESADKTLGWDWKVDSKGARKLRVYQWAGDHYAQVLFNDVPAPPGPPKP